MTDAKPQAYRPPPMPKVRAVTRADIREALRRGVADFARAPLYGFFFGGIYAAGGMLILAALTVLDMPWMIIFVAVGFPLVGPFVAVGLYEVSRRLAAGRPLVWGEVLGVVVAQKDRQLAWMAFVVLFVFWIWIYQVRLLLALFLGLKPFSSLPDFLAVVTTTPEGIGFLAVGTVVGAGLAFVLFTATVVAMPLLLERDIDFITAIITSFRAVLASPAAMLGWGALVAALAMLAMVPAFLGLLFVLPVLGHATWHLYGRAVEPAG